MMAADPGSSRYAAGLFNDSHAVVNSSWLSYESSTQAAEDIHNDPRIEQLRTIGQGIIIPSICLIGMCLNMLNVSVLLSGKFPQSTYTYLANLAVADFLSLLLFGVNGIGRGHYHGVVGWRIFEVYVYFPCGMISTTASILLTVTVTVERFIFIYKPTSSKKLCQQRLARRVSLLLWIFCLIYNVPRFFVFQVQNGELSYTAFSASTAYIFFSWFFFITVSLGASLVLIVFNILLLRGLRRLNERRRTMTHQHHRTEEQRLTRTLISVIFVFVLGELPSAVLSRTAVVAILGHGSKAVLASLEYQIAAFIATVLVVSQHSLNFVIYCVFNTRFLAVFKAQACRHSMHHINDDVTVHEQTCVTVHEHKDNGIGKT